MDLETVRLVSLAQYLYELGVSNLRLALMSVYSPP